MVAPLSHPYERGGDTWRLVFVACSPRDSLEPPQTGQQGVVVLAGRRMIDDALGTCRVGNSVSRPCNKL